MVKLKFEMYRATSKVKTFPRDKKLLLNSNDNMGWRQKANIVAKLRGISYEIAWEYRCEKENQSIYFDKSNPCGVTITVFSPSSRRLDPDNVQPTVKALMDGITDSGLWEDDNHEVVKFTKYQYGGLSGSKSYRLEIDIKSI